MGDWTVETVKEKNGVTVKRIKVAGRMVKLKVPVLYDGHEIWVEGEGLAKALGLRLGKKGQTIALLPK